MPACPLLLVRYAPTVVFVGWTVQALGRQSLSAALFGAVLTTGFVFAWQAWRARRRVR